MSNLGLQRKGPEIRLHPMRHWEVTIGKREREVGQNVCLQQGEGRVSRKHGGTELCKLGLWVERNEGQGGGDMKECCWGLVTD